MPIQLRCLPDILPLFSSVPLPVSHWSIPASDPPKFLFAFLTCLFLIYQLENKVSTPCRIFKNVAERMTLNTFLILILPACRVLMMLQVPGGL